MFIDSRLFNQASISPLLADLRTNNRQLGKVRVKVKYRLVILWGHSD